MRLLIDTHYLIWLVDQPQRLTQVEHAMLRDRRNELAISSVSIWEIRLKFGARHPSGERKGTVAPEAAIRVANDLGLRIIDMTERHAATTLDTPITHKDPFDELLLVQAQVEGMRLLTRDTLLASHPLALIA